MRSKDVPKLRDIASLQLLSSSLNHDDKEILSRQLAEQDDMSLHPLFIISSSSEPRHPKLRY